MTNPKILQNVRLIQKCIVVDKQGLILALKRQSTDHSRGGCWDLPGGGYEQGEDVIDAIKREVKEEASLIINNPKPIYFTNKVFSNSDFFKGDTVFATCYVSRDWSGEIKLSDEHFEYRWINPQEFLKYHFGSDDGFFSASVSAYMKYLK